MPCRVLSSPLQVSGAVTRLTVYRAVQHFQPFGGHVAARSARLPTRDGKPCETWHEHWSFIVGLEPLIDAFFSRDRQAVCRKTAVSCVCDIYLRNLFACRDTDKDDLYGESLDQLLLRNSERVTARTTRILGTLRNLYATNT